MTYEGDLKVCNLALSLGEDVQEDFDRDFDKDIIFDQEDELSDCYNEDYDGLADEQDDRNYRQNPKHYSVESISQRTYGVPNDLYDRYPEDERYLESGVEDTDGDTFAEYTEYFFETYEEGLFDS